MHRLDSSADLINKGDSIRYAKVEPEKCDKDTLAQVDLEIGKQLPPIMGSSSIVRRFVTVTDQTDSGHAIADISTIVEDFEAGLPTQVKA